MTTTKQTDEIRAVLVESDSRGFHECHVCGSTIGAAVVVQVADTFGKYDGFTVCPDCLDGIDGRLAEHAARLLHEAEALRALIGRLKLPTRDAAKRAERLFWAAQDVAKRQVSIAELFKLPVEKQEALLEAHGRTEALRDLFPERPADDDSIEF